MGVTDVLGACPDDPEGARIWRERLILDARRATLSKGREGRPGPVQHHRLDIVCGADDFEKIRAYAEAHDVRIAGHRFYPVADPEEGEDGGCGQNPGLRRESGGMSCTR